jgi:antitoxin component HigA of HigAB toxin-antitoxin module
MLNEQDMGASDLGRLLGNRPLGSAILRGERELSKAHIRILADHFKVSTDLFFN